VVFSEKMKFFAFPDFTPVLRELAAGSFADLGSYRKIMTLLFLTYPYMLGYPQTYPQVALQITDSFLLFTRPFCDST
jgi:hypothetical protein